MPVLPSSAASPASIADLDGSDPTTLCEEEVVAAFDSLLHAELVRGRLQASGIGARLQDPHIVGLASHLAVASGGVKVVVATKDANDARELLHTPALPDDGTNDDLPTRPLHHLDDGARWALRLSLVGVVLPVVGQVASCACALQAFTARKTLTPRGGTQLVIAIAIDIGVSIAWGQSL